MPETKIKTPPLHILLAEALLFKRVLGAGWDLLTSAHNDDFVFLHISGLYFCVDNGVPATPALSEAILATLGGAIADNLTGRHDLQVTQEDLLYTVKLNKVLVR